MKWYIIDSDYINYLRNTDNKIQSVDYGTNRIKPFVGVIINIDKINYCVPVSSPKIKHKRMKDSIDFIKLTNLNNTHLFGVINLNNMIPVKNENMTPLLYKDIDRYVNFLGDEQKESYIRLLKNELLSINDKEDKIRNNAKKLRDICIEYPNSKYAKRSCNFALLEQKCAEYANSQKKEEDKND